MFLRTINYQYAIQVQPCTDNQTAKTRFHEHLEVCTFVYDFKTRSTAFIMRAIVDELVQFHIIGSIKTLLLASSRIE